MLVILLGDGAAFEAKTGFFMYSTLDFLLFL